MASACEIRIAGLSRRQASMAAKAAIDEVRRIEIKFSRYRTDGIVPRINASAGRAPVECDSETLELLRYADALFETSSGLFDATSGVLRRAWNFNVPALPDPYRLAELLPLINWKSVELNDRSVRLPIAGMELDFGGFGKEYAVDRACGVLIAEGVRHGLVNLGGDVRAVGPQPDGSAWSIGIQDPRDSNQVLASLPLFQGALATSGDYERYVEIDGRRYCHILNPQTGMSVSSWRSISVLAPVAMAAGGYSTIAMLQEGNAASWLDAETVPWLGMDVNGTLHFGKTAPGR